MTIEEILYELEENSIGVGGGYFVDGAALDEAVKILKSLQMNRESEED